MLFLLWKLQVQQAFIKSFGMQKVKTYSEQIIQPPTHPFQNKSSNLKVKAF